jgi:hypothetical protein
MSRLSRRRSRGVEDLQGWGMWRRAWVDLRGVEIGSRVKDWEFVRRYEGLNGLDSEVLNMQE